MHTVFILVWLAVVVMRAINAYSAYNATGDTKPIGEPMPEPMPPPYGISI